MMKSEIKILQRRGNSGRPLGDSPSDSFLTNGQLLPSIDPPAYLIHSAEQFFPTCLTFAFRFITLPLCFSWIREAVGVLIESGGTVNCLRGGVASLGAASMIGWEWPETPPPAFESRIDGQWGRQPKRRRKGEQSRPSEFECTDE